jgi:Protein of unknown function (DUF3102)
MELAKSEPTQVARPLRILVSLIKEDLEQVRKAEDEAGMPHKRAVGEKMIEAKSQLQHGEFKAWIERNFKITMRSAQYYMSLVEVEKRTGVRFSSLDDLRRRHHGEDRTPGSRRDAAWQAPIKEAIGRVNVEALKQDALAKQEERALQRKLALSLIDIGYKALAAKLHPDKGGSREAMIRLNRVRELLRGAVT